MMVPTVLSLASRVAFGSDDEEFGSHEVNADHGACGADGYEAPCMDFDLDEPVCIPEMTELLSIRAPGSPIQMCMAKDIQVLTRTQLKQQLLDKIKTTKKKKKAQINFDGQRTAQFEGEHITKANDIKTPSRGSKLVTLVNATRPMAPISRTDNITQPREYIYQNRDDCENPGKDEMIGDENQHANASVCLSPIQDDTEHEVSLVDMLGSTSVSLDADLSTDFNGEPAFDMDDEVSFHKPVGNAPDEFIKELGTAQQQQQIVEADAACSPIMLSSDPIFAVIQNHIADLSPEENIQYPIRDHGGDSDTEEAENNRNLVPETNCRNKEVSFEKNFSLKSPTCAASDRVPPRLREVVLNSKLAECWKKGEHWAQLDIFGVELNHKINHEELMGDLITSMTSEMGEYSVNQLLTEIEEEWQHVKSVRQKYSTGNNTIDAPRSILKRSPAMCSKSTTMEAGTLRWAEPEQINQQLIYNGDDEFNDDREGANRPYDVQSHSTRGLRMLLASSAAVSHPGTTQHSQQQQLFHTGGRTEISPPSGISPMANETSRTHARIRRRTPQRVGKSQGQRLLKALQQAASTRDAGMLPMDAPKALSTTLT